MAFLEDQLFSAFDNGIKTIFCKHSDGEKHTENATQGIHQHREILYVLKGNTNFFLNHKFFNVKAGDVVLVDRWVAHYAGFSQSERDLIFLWFCFFPSRVMTIIHQVDSAGNRNFILKWIKIASDVGLVVNRHWDEFAELPPDYALDNIDRYLKGPLTMLLDELRFYLYLHGKKDKQTHNSRDIANEIVRIIEAKNGRNCSLNQLSKFTGFNRFYISHLFKNTYNVSIGDYIDLTRMKFYDSARKQGLTYKQIALELGFSTPSSLSNWVHKKRKE